MSKTSKRNNNKYYNDILLQFLGLECEIEKHTEFSYLFTHNFEAYILFTGANKIQVKTTAKWIDNADVFIIDNILKENKPPYLTVTIKEYTI